MDDEALLERARRGDRDAFTLLVERHQDALYTMALRVVGRPADAADVVQETFLRAYVNLPKLRGLTVRAWLFRVAVNAAHDVQRRLARRPSDPLEDGAGNLIDFPDTSPGPEERSLSRERVVAVRDALAELPEEFRAAVVLRDINDLSYEEVAAVLRVPLGTVKSRINRGRLLLARGLQQSAVFAMEGEG